MTGTSDGARTDVASTITLTAVTAAVTWGFVRVFASTSFLVPLLGVVLLAHLVAALTRRWAAVVSILVMLAVGALATIDITHWQAVTHGLPTTSTFDTIRASLDVSIDILRHGSAPVPAEPGLLFVLSVALWVVAWSADRLTFTYRAPTEALVPSATVFVIVTALAGPAHRWSAAALYAASVALHVLVRRHAASYGSGHIHWRPVARGTAMAAVTLGIGLGAAATVPALSPDGLIPVRNKRTLTVVNPLVDIGSVLSDQPDTELFTVTASTEQYWRLMALDDFDGTRWGPPRFRLDDAAGTLTRSTDDGKPNFDVLDAEFVLSGLGGSFAPAPFEARYVSEVTDEDGDRVAMGWDPESATLVATDGESQVAHTTYWVTAHTPNVGPGDVRRADGAVPTAIRDTATRLPADFPDDLRRQAEAIVAGATTPYDKALALQAFFRDPRNGFTYSTRVPDRDRGGDDDAIRAFLEDRVGFCEQFAGTFGALARAVGLPTRLVVGFTWGESARANVDGTRDFVVRGRNAHAWPEVYFADLGWLPFEPTPGRGNPTAEAYTGVAADQDNEPSTSPVTSTTPPATSAPDVAPTTTVAGSPPTTGPDRDPAVVTRSTSPPTSGAIPGSWTPLVLVAMVALAVAIGPGIRALRRRRRIRRADTPAGRVRLAWADTLRAWRPLDLVRTDVDTDRDVGDRLARRVANLVGSGDPALQAQRLAELAAAAAWNEGAITAVEADEAAGASQDLRAIARTHRSRWSRFVGWFDPR